MRATDNEDDNDRQNSEITNRHSLFLYDSYICMVHLGLGTFLWKSKK